MSFVLISDLNVTFRAALNVQLEVFIICYFGKKGDIFQGIQEMKHLHLEQLHPAFLFGLDALLHLRVGLDAHAPEGGHVLLAVLGFGLGVRQLDDPQARVPQTARQSHELRQREGHHGGLRPTCGDAGLICFLL